MTRPFAFITPAALLAVACTATQPEAIPASPGPGLAGIVRRGPVTPVCLPDIPCDAPFSARFEVRQGQIIVARFTSDSAGRFQVRLRPGAYTIVPDASAPLLDAAHQVQPVIVTPGPMRVVELSFDTGIR